MFLSRHLEENCCYTSISSEHSEVGCHLDQHLYSALRAECSSRLRKTVQASAVNTLRWAAIRISISTQPWKLSAAVNTSRWAAIRISIYSALRAQLTSSGETFRRTLISKSIRPCSTRSRRELPKRQQMALNSLAEGGGTPGSTGITVIEVMNMKVL